MAFYNRKMAKNKSLAKAWRAAHLGRVGDEEIYLPEICNEIAQWIRRDRHPRSRLSLRSFSVLLSGAARLYSRQLNRLMKDTFKFTLLNSVTPRPVLSTAEISVSRSECSDEESLDLMPEIEVPEINSTTGNESESGSTEYPNDTQSSLSDEDEEMSDDESTVFTVTPNSDQQSATDEPEKRDQQMQTSPIPESVVNINGFNPNLPFGYVIVHDSYHSRIPSKILFSSLSENVKFLPANQ